MYDFTGAASRFRGRHWQDAPRTYRCEQCQDKGKYSVSDSQSPIPLAYRCPCPAGLTVSALIPYRPGTAPPPQIEEPEAESSAVRDEDSTERAWRRKPPRKPSEYHPPAPEPLPGVSAGWTPPEQTGTGSVVAEWTGEED